MARTLEVNAQKIDNSNNDMEEMADRPKIGSIFMKVSEDRLAFDCNSCPENFGEHLIKEHNHKLNEVKMKNLDNDECILLSDDSDVEEEELCKEIRNARNPLGINRKVQEVQQSKNEYIILSSDSDMEIEEIRDEIRNTRNPLGINRKVQEVQQCEDECIVLSSESDTDVEEIHDEIRNEYEPSEINGKVGEVQECVEIVDVIPVDQNGKVHHSLRVQESQNYSECHYVNEGVGHNARILPELNNFINENVASFTRLNGTEIHNDSYHESNGLQIVGTNHQGIQEDLDQQTLERNIQLDFDINFFEAVEHIYGLSAPRQDGSY